MLAKQAEDSDDRLSHIAGVRVTASSAFGFRSSGGVVTVDLGVTSAVDIGALVRQTRQARGVTQRDLADQAGTTRQWVIRFEQGHHAPTMSTLFAVLSVLDLEMVIQHDLPARMPRQPRSAVERRMARLFAAVDTGSLESSTSAHQR